MKMQRYKIHTNQRTQVLKNLIEQMFPDKKSKRKEKDSIKSSSSANCDILTSKTEWSDFK